MLRYDCPRTEAERIGGRKTEIKGLLKKIEGIRQRLGGNPNADNEGVILHMSSPREALDTAERQLNYNLEQLEPGGKGYEYANPGNAKSWIEAVEEYLT